MSWRTRARFHLGKIADEARKLITEDKLKEARQLVRDTYPFGDREYTPYKIWCEEVKKAIPGLYPRRKPFPVPAGLTPLNLE